MARPWASTCSRWTWYPSSEDRGGSVMKSPGSLLLLSLMLWAVAGAAQAQATRAGGGDQALKRAQYMLRMLNDEKSALEAEVARLGEERGGLEQEVAKLEARNRGLEERLDQA